MRLWQKKDSPKDSPKAYTNTNKQAVIRKEAESQDIKKKIRDRSKDETI